MTAPDFDARLEVAAAKDWLMLQLSSLVADVMRDLQALHDEAANDIAAVVPIIPRNVHVHPNGPAVELVAIAVTRAGDTRSVVLANGDPQLIDGDGWTSATAPS